jgi:hypothetical protein
MSGKYRVTYDGQSRLHDRITELEAERDAAYDTRTQEAIDAMEKGIRLKEDLAESDARIKRLEAEVTRLQHAARVAAGALLLIRSADTLTEKERIAVGALNAFMNLSGFERGTLTPDEARAALGQTGGE